MKSIYVVILCCLASMTNAKSVEEHSALQVASNYYRSRSNSDEFKLYTAYKEVFNDTVLYYVFNSENNKGWVIVAATDAIFPILGFSSKSAFPLQENQPPALIYWLNKYKKQILTIIRENINPTDESKERWRKLLSKERNEIYKSISVVEPLLDTEWDQDEYYNYWCPNNCMTGCTATAMAQIMKYWEQPVNGTGDHCYYTPNYAEELCANFGITTYDWDAMPNQVTSINTPVATLMYHCGVAVEMNYCQNGLASGAWVLAVDAAGWPDFTYYCSEHAYVDFFGYDANTIEAVFRGSDDNYWINNVLKPELDAGRPIQYVADDNTLNSSHTWVCDGYNSDNLFHMNWGWGGYGNGEFYDINVLIAGGYTFDDYERALIGIQPAISVISNDDPCDAITLQVSENCEFTEVTNVGATNSTIPNVYCDGTSNGDVWFSCEIPGSGILTITSDEGPIVDDIGIAYYSGTCNNLTYLGCSANGSSYSPYMPMATISGTPGQTIWIRAWEYNNNNFGAFYICAYGSGGSSTGEIELTDYEIDDNDSGSSSGDNDGLCEPGEVIEMSIELHNTGNDPIDNVEAFLSTNDPDIEVTDNDLFFGIIYEGEYAWESDFCFSISETCEEKDVIFDVAITSDEGNWNETITIHIYVSNETPVADFTAMPVSGNSPLTVNFSDLSSNATDWWWEFGDGTNSELQNPAHIYYSAGSYTVSLTVNNGEVYDVEVKTNYISVTETGDLPVADFIGSPLSGNSPLTVNFTDLSSNATSWFWDFGDGNTTTIQHPNHTYNSIGIYDVSLTVQNDDGSDAEIKTNYVNVTGTGNLPVADFYSDVNSGNAPLYIVFTNTSYNADTWFWDFGDGTTSYYTSPYHTYSNPGYYTVSLTVTNEFGSDTEIKQDYIHVTVEGTPPISNFTCNNLTGQYPLSVNFTDQSLYSPTSWHWVFGDGYTSDFQHPVHIYQYPGTFTVSLTTSNDYGTDIETKVNYITVYDNSPNPGFGCDNSEGPCPLTIDFVDLSTNFPTSWQWNFGDGFTSNLQNPQHIYTIPGIYTVILTVTNQYGSNTITGTDFIHVYESGPLPYADFTSDKIVGTNPLTVSFNNISNGGEEWEWQFGDGNISFSENPVYTFSNPGYYTITLTARNQSGFDLEVKENYIHVISSELLPVADFGVNKTYGQRPLTVNFYDYSQNTNAWNWQFGDGNMSSSQNPVYTYSNIGDYTVTLKVNNQYGEDILTKTNFIHVVEGNPNGYDESAEQNKYSIIPNPSNGVFTVYHNANNIEESTYEVYSISGIKLKKGILFDHEKNIIDVSSLNPGIYIFTITTAKKIYNTRIIII